LILTLTVKRKMRKKKKEIEKKRNLSNLLKNFLLPPILELKAKQI